MKSSPLDCLFKTKFSHYLFGFVEADADEDSETDAGDKEGEEEAAKDSLSGQKPSPRGSGGVDKAGPGIAQEHPSCLGQNTRLGGLVSLLGN